MSSLGEQRDKGAREDLSPEVLEKKGFNTKVISMIIIIMMIIIDKTYKAHFTKIQCNALVKRKLRKSKFMNEKKTNVFLI